MNIYYNEYFNGKDNMVYEVLEADFKNHFDVYLQEL